MQKEHVTVFRRRHCSIHALIPDDEDIWRGLSACAPVGPGLVALLSRFDDLGLRELEERLDACDSPLREWAGRPENHRRPVHEAPGHLEPSPSGRCSSGDSGGSDAVSR